MLVTGATGVQGGADPDARAGYDFAQHQGGRQADIAALRELHPGLMDFDAWLDREGAALFQKGSPPAA
ncbi:hypothetical protein [Actinomadura sp. GTD37]|uniref:hypothetical protein n=1 Tax=Actinomadura sp. GTD37 TaxID=1778030 RepID=UPI0035C02165